MLFSSATSSPFCTRAHLLILWWTCKRVGGQRRTAQFVFTQITAVLENHSGTRLHDTLENGTDHMAYPNPWVLLMGHWNGSKTRLYQREDRQKQFNKTSYVYCEVKHNHVPIRALNRKYLKVFNPQLSSTEYLCARSLNLTIVVVPKPNHSVITSLNRFIFSSLIYAVLERTLTKYLVFEFGGLVIRHTNHGLN